MKWLYKLENTFGRFAIRNLMKYIVLLNGIAFVLIYFDPTGMLESRLILIPELVLRGEVWRLITFIFIPPTTSIFWVVFVLQFYYMIGTSLEHEWGSFRFNLYYLLGVLGTAVAAMVFGVMADPFYINLSLFLAFARIYPDYELLIFFVVPVKVKYLAMLDWAFFALSFVTGNTVTRILVVVALINYFIFFGKDILKRTSHNRQAYNNRQRFKKELPREFTYHKCTVCGKTEKDDPKLEFRYCNECEGDYEYCMEHVRNHEHRTKPSNVIEFKSRQE